MAATSRISTIFRRRLRPPRCPLRSPRPPTMSSSGWWSCRLWRLGSSIDSTRCIRPRSRRSRTTPRRAPGSRPGRPPQRRCSPSGRTTAATGRSGSRAARTPGSGGRHLHDLHDALRPERPERLGGEGRAVRAGEHVAVPLEGAARSRAAPTQRSTTRKSLGAPDSSRSPEQEALALLHEQHPPARVVQPHVPRDLRRRRAHAGRAGSAVRDAEHGGADALINCWDDKAFWSFWRPITAIRMGDDDGNPKTDGDPTWTSLEGNPPYPDHTSGYNCVTGAFMHTAGAFFGKKPMAFDLEEGLGRCGRDALLRPVRGRDRRHDRRACTRASTSERRTSREPPSARTSLTGSTRTSSSR